MKINIIIILVLFTLGFSLSEKRMVEITFNKLIELQQLVDMGIDLDHHRTLTEIHAFVTDEEFQLISQRDFGIREIPNEAKLYFEELKQNTMGSRNPMEDYHNYIELTAFLQDIADNYPDITRLESIGQSVQGRELWVIEISDNPGVNEIEPEFKYVANMHGDETVGRELSLYLIEWLVEGYGSDPRATDIINNIESASYIKLREVSFSYSVNPKNVKTLGLNGLDVRLSFRDLLTVSNYSGWDPETNMMQNRITGEDYFNQPQTWGANLSLYIRW